MERNPLFPALFRDDRRPMPTMKALHQEIDRVFHDFGRGFWSLPQGDQLDDTAFLAPRMDVVETEKAVEVSVELPGVKEDDTDVSVSGRQLTIRGEKKAESEQKDANNRVLERSYGSFMRSFTLPFEIGASDIEAVFDDGILKIKIPKPPQAVQTSEKVAIRKAG